MSTLAEPLAHHGSAELAGRPRPGNFPGSATDDAVLITFLRSHDIPCPGCRYNLRGLRSSACPECGASLSLHVGSPRIALGAWLAAVLAVSMPFGFALVLSVVALVGSLVQIAWLPGDWQALTVLVSATVLFGGIVIYVARARENLLSQPSALQWLAACAAGTAALIEAGLLVVILNAMLE